MTYFSGGVREIVTDCDKGGGWGSKNAKNSVTYFMDGTFCRRLCYVQGTHIYLRLMFNEIFNSLSNRIQRLVAASFLFKAKLPRRGAQMFVKECR